MGVMIAKGEVGTFVGEFGASHCGTGEPIDLSFGVVYGSAQAFMY